MAAGEVYSIAITEITKLDNIFEQNSQRASAIFCNTSRKFYNHGIDVDEIIT